MLHSKSTPNLPPKGNQKFREEPIKKKENGHQHEAKYINKKQTMKRNKWNWNQKHLVFRLSHCTKLQSFYSGTESTQLRGKSYFPVCFLLLEQQTTLKHIMLIQIYLQYLVASADAKCSTPLKKIDQYVFLEDRFLWAASLLRGVH